MADYGLEFAGFEDIDPSWSTVTGLRALAHAIARRLTTPAGGLIGDPDYGFDLRGQLNSVVNPAFLEARIADECLKDERIDDASVSVTFDGATQTMTVVITLTPSDADSFPLTLNVSQVSVALLIGAA